MAVEDAIPDHGGHGHGVSFFRIQKRKNADPKNRTLETKPNPNPTQTRPKFCDLENLGRVWVAFGSRLVAFGGVWGRFGVGLQLICSVRIPGLVLV